MVLTGWTARGKIEALDSRRERGPFAHLFGMCYIIKFRDGRLPGELITSVTQHSLSPPYSAFLLDFNF